jgi:hypothetical protein
MNNQFDELTKSLAQSVTRRAALKKFGVALAGMTLACFGLANKAHAATYSGYCQAQPQPFWPSTKGNNKQQWFGTGICVGVDPVTGGCLGASNAVTGGTCPIGGITQAHVSDSACGGFWLTHTPCSFTL